MRIKNRNNRVVLLIGLLHLLLVNGNTQDARPEDIPMHTHNVYRSDGSILKGEITEWTADYLMLRLLSGLEIKIEAGEVHKVVSRNIRRAAYMRSGHVRREYLFKDEGLYHVTTGAFSTGPYAALGLTHAVGYRWSRLLSAGGGVGVESYDLGSGNQIVPVFAEMRGFFMNQNISPYYALRAGYGFALRNSESNVSSTRGGRMLGFELGYRFGGTRAMNFFTGVGMHFQNATYVYEWPWEERFTDKVRHRRTELRIGVIF